MADPTDAKKDPRKCCGILHQGRRFFFDPSKWPILRMPKRSPESAVESCTRAADFAGSVQMADPKDVKKVPRKCSGILHQGRRFFLGPSKWPLLRMPKISPENAVESCTRAVDFFWVRPNGRFYGCQEGPQKQWNLAPEGVVRVARNSCG